MTASLAQPKLQDRASARTSDRLLAESVRLYESASTEPLDDKDAVDAAIALEDADFESRIIARAESLSVSESIRNALAKSKRIIFLTLCALVLIAVIAGGVAANAALMENTANVFALIAGLLGIQTLLLFVWLVLNILVSGLSSRTISGGGGLLGRVAVFCSQKVISILHLDAFCVAAFAARFRVATTGKSGRWTVATLTHCLWLAINLGILAQLAILFIGEGYQFRWDSTWLSSNDTYRGLITSLAAIPEWAGFTVPTAEQIDASRVIDAAGNIVQDAKTREAWSWLFFGSVVIYGLMPRTLLFVISILFQRCAVSKYRLDLDLPEYVKLRTRLLNQAEITELHDSTSAVKTHEETGTEGKSEIARIRPVGKPAIVGLEITEPECGWPLPFTNLVIDLGLIDGRDDEHRVIAELSSSDTSPERLLVVCECSTTPDRGVKRIIREFKAAASSDVSLVLTAGRAKATEGADAKALAQRLEDWKTLAVSVGIDQEDVIELDLDHLTAQTRSQLNALVNREDSLKESSGALDKAFRLIDKHTKAWRNSVSMREQVELQQQVGNCFKHSRSGLRDLTGIISAKFDFNDPAALTINLKSAAARFTDILPPALRMNPKWLAAGALAGAAGCTAAAIALFPAAIAALPAWSLIGASIGAAVSSLTSTTKNAEVETGTDTISLDDAIRAAVIYAVVLETQLLSEAAISRVLESTFKDEDSPIDNISTWLKEIKHKVELAIVEEMKK